MNRVLELTGAALLLIGGVLIGFSGQYFIAAALSFIAMYIFWSGKRSMLNDLQVDAIRSSTNPDPKSVLEYRKKHPEKTVMEAVYDLKD